MPSLRHGRRSCAERFCRAADLALAVELQSRGEPFHKGAGEGAGEVADEIEGGLPRTAVVSADATLLRFSCRVRHHHDAIGHGKKEHVPHHVIHVGRGNPRTTWTSTTSTSQKTTQTHLSAPLIKIQFSLVADII